MLFLKKKIINKIETFCGSKIKKILILNNSKLVIYLKDNSKIIKICKDNFNKNLFLNEKKGYSFFKKVKTLKKISKIEFFKNFYGYSIFGLTYFNGEKLNYFESLLFIKKKRHLFKNINKVSLHNISQIYKNNFKKIFLYKLDKEFKNDFFNLNQKYPRTYIFIAPSHGDLVNSNILKNKNGEICVIDFEYFSKKRIYLFDVINLILTPVINKIVLSFGISLNLHFFFKAWLKIIFFFIGIKINNFNLNQYLDLFYLEKKYFFKMTETHKRKYPIYNVKTIKESVKLFNYFSKLLN